MVTNLAFSPFLLFKRFTTSVYTLSKSQFCSFIYDYVRSLNDLQQTEWFTNYAIASSLAFKRLIWGTFALLTAFLGASIMTVFLQCIPLSQFWDLTLLPHEKNCINTTAFFYSTSVFNIVTDVWILLLPVKLLWRVQRPTFQKVVLLGVFAVGSFACIASCIRLYVSSL
jgi:hypothetical protein